MKEKFRLTNGTKKHEIHLPWILDEKQWETMSESERNAILDECFTYDDFLRKNGHFAGGEALESPRNATTIRLRNGQVSITDGPYTETKEQLGGIFSARSYGPESCREANVEASRREVRQHFRHPCGRRYDRDDP